MHARLDVGVDARGAGAFVLADFGSDVGRQRDQQIGKDRTDQVAGPDFVCRVGVGVQERDGQRLDAELVHEAAGGFQDGLLVQRRVFRAVGAHPSGHAEPPVPGHDDRGGTRVQVRYVVPDLAAHLQDVTEPLGGDQAHRRAGMLQHGVGDQGGAVHDAGHLPDRGVGVAQQLPDALDDGPVRRLRRGEPLADRRQAARLVVQDEVGERATHVHAHSRGPVHGFSHPPARRLRRSRGRRLRE